MLISTISRNCFKLVEDRLLKKDLFPLEILNFIKTGLVSTAPSQLLFDFLKLLHKVFISTISDMLLNGERSTFLNELCH